MMTTGDRAVSVLPAPTRSEEGATPPTLGVTSGARGACAAGAEHGLVNWDKARMEAGIIREVNLFQLTAYKLEPVTLVQELLLGLDRRDDDDLYARSLAREPRQRA